MGFLRSLFGPSKAEVWDQLAKEVGGDFVEGGFFGKSKVEAAYGEWTITLDTYTVSSGTGNSRTTTTYTRLRAPFVNKDGFNFNIYRKSIFSGLGKMFGMQDIEVGYPEFDEDFIIKSNNETKMKEFMQSARIRELFACQPRISVKVQDDEGAFFKHFPDGVDALYFTTTGVIKDVEILKQLFFLFAEILDRLCHIGSAYEDDPNTELN